MMPGIGAGARGTAGYVQTTAGPIDPSELGVTLVHEQLLVKGWDHRSTNYANSLYMELAQVRSAGGRSLVVVDGDYAAGDPAFCRAVGDRAGLRTIVGTGFRRASQWPTDEREALVDTLASRLIEDITRGIAGTGIRAGLIADVPISRRAGPFERMLVTAAGLAQKETGGAIGLRLEIGASAAEYHDALDTLDHAGAALDRVAVFGLVPRPDNLALFQAIAGRGPFLGFDLYGQDHRQHMAGLINTPRSVLAASIKGLLYHGLGEQILLSQRVDHLELFTVNGGDGYAHLLNEVVPAIQEFRVSDDDIRMLLVDNPRRWMTMH